MCPRATEGGVQVCAEPEVAIGDVRKQRRLFRWHCQDLVADLRCKVTAENQVPSCALCHECWELRRR